MLYQGHVSTENQFIKMCQKCIMASPGPPSPLS